MNKKIISASDNVVLKLKVLAQEKERARKKLAVTAKQLATTAKEKESVRRKLLITAKNLDIKAKQLAVTAKEKESVRRKLVITAKRLAVIAKEKEGIRLRLAVTTKKLNESEDRLGAKAREKAMLAGIGDGVIGTDSDGKIIFMNQIAKTMLGWHSANMVGKVLYDTVVIEDEKGNLVPSEKRPMHFALAGTTTTTTTTDPNYQYVRKDKTKFPVTITVTPVILNQRITGAVEVFRDITKEKESYAALEYANDDLKKYKMAIDAASDNIIITDDKGTILHANKRMESFTGYSREEAIGGNASLWGGQMPKEFYADMWKTIREDKKPFSAELKNRRKNGELYDAEIHISPVFGESGDIRYFIGVERDISETKKLTNDLIKFKLALDNASDQVTITDPEGTVIYANATVETITGYKPEEAIGKKCGVLWKSPMPTEFYENLWHTIEDEKKVFMGEIRNRRKNGELYTAVISVSPVLDRDENIIFFVGIERDVTKERAVDMEKTEFVSLASHQLKTPVGALSWDLEMFLAGDYGKLTEKQKEVVREMYAMNRRMNELINGLLNISRIDMGVFIIEPVPTDFGALCDEVLLEMEPRILERQHHVVKTYGAETKNIPADPKLLRIIFLNYISNAVKYTHEKGEIQIAIEKKENDVVISVTNNGDPIPEKDKSKIFNKLFRASNAQELDPDGNGLGLYLVKKIAENGGGEAWFTSDAKGTVFYISFPLAGMKKKDGTNVLS